MAHRVLVVDDEHMVCRMLRKFFESKDCYVAVAHSGDEALEVFKKERPDVVLLDILMPGKNGLDTLLELRALDPDVPIIMVTAVKNDESGVEALKRGATGYVTKPIEPDFLWDVVCAKIKMRAVRKEFSPGKGKEDNIGN